MARILAPPAGFNPPSLTAFYMDGRFLSSAYNQAESQYVKSLQEEASKSGGTGDLVGKIIQFPVADGYATYIVWRERPLELIHIATGDAWQIPLAHGRGLKLKDVRGMVARDKLFAKLTEVARPPCSASSGLSNADEGQ